MSYFKKKSGIQFSYMEGATGISESELCQIAQGKTNVTIQRIDIILKFFILTILEFYGEDITPKTKE